MAEIPTDQRISIALIKENTGDLKGMKATVWAIKSRSL
jgi:hypothetical protein